MSAPTLLAWSAETAALLELSPQAFDDPQFAQQLAEVMAGNRQLPGMQPYAACYGGHQFGNWAGQLGDGRAISLIETFRKATPGYAPELLGREWAPFEELGMRRGLAMRDNLVRPENVVDVHYADVMRDPIGVIERAYSHFGVVLSAESKARIQRFLAENAKDKHGAHAYSAEQFGLSERMLRTLFKDYTDRFNLL